jgi:hypothetical protein
MKFPNQRNENVSELLKMAQSQQRFGETIKTMFRKEFQGNTNAFKVTL